MTPTMVAALAEARLFGRLVKGRAGWTAYPARYKGYSTRTVEALVARGFLVIDGRADRWGAEAMITNAGVVAGVGQ